MNYIIEQLAWIVLICIATVLVIPPIHALGYWMQRHKTTIDNYAWILVSVLLAIVCYCLETKKP